MYSVTELAKMYNTTRATIYSKLLDTSIHQYVIEAKTGKRLQSEGLNQFQLLMSQSKCIDKCIDDTQVDTNYTNDYIDNLKERIAELESDKKVLTRQIEFQNEFMRNQLLLLSASEQKSPSEEPKKSFFQRIFNR